MDVAFFDNARDRWPKRHTLAWTDLGRRLTSFPHREVADKTELSAWSPVTYPERIARPEDGQDVAVSRRAAYVATVNALVLDYDEGEDPAEVDRRWEGYERIFHSSWSHTVEAPRFRVVLPLAVACPGPIWTGVWTWARTQLDGGHADVKCSDPSRIYFLPATDGRRDCWARWRGVGRPWLDLSGLWTGQIHPEVLAVLEPPKPGGVRQPVRVNPFDFSRVDREVRRRLKEDPIARAALGERLGGTRVARPKGDIVLGLQCPACGRPDAWFLVDPAKKTTAECNHRKTCGWWGSLWDLAVSAGQERAA